MELHNRQPVVDSILEAGRAVIQSEGGAKATETRAKLEAMNRALESIRTKIGDRRVLLEDALKDVSGILKTIKINNIYLYSSENIKLKNRNKDKISGTSDLTKNKLRRITKFHKEYSGQQNNSM